MKKLFICLALLFCVAAKVSAQAPSESRYVGLGQPALVAKEIAKQGIITSKTVTNNDAQDNTLTIAEIVGGITVHTSVTGGGTVTTDTAANIIAGSGSVELAADNDCITHYYINDGSQTLTFAGGAGVTVSDTGQTLATNESAVLLFCRTSSTAVTVHIVGG